MGNIVSARNTVLEFGTLPWHPGVRVKFGTNKQKWDFFGTISGLWFLLGESPKFGTLLRALQCRAYLFGGGVKDGP